MRTKLYGMFFFIFKQCIHIGAMETCHLGMFIIIPSIFPIKVLHRSFVGTFFIGSINTSDSDYQIPEDWERPKKREIPHVYNCFNCVALLPS